MFMPQTRQTSPSTNGRECMISFAKGDAPAVPNGVNGVNGTATDLMPTRPKEDNGGCHTVPTADNGSGPAVATVDNGPGAGKARWPGDQEVTIGRLIDGSCAPE